METQRDHLAQQTGDQRAALISVEKQRKERKREREKEKGWVGEGEVLTLFPLDNVQRGIEGRAWSVLPL